MNKHPFFDFEMSMYWPANKPVDTSDIKDGGRWELMMNGGGTVVLWDSEADEPSVPGEYEGEFLPFYASDDREKLERFLVMFCRRGYETNSNFKYQDGTVWIFNWRSFTLWQLSVARRVAHLFMTGDVDGAWTFGRWAEDQIRAAETHESRPDPSS